MKIFVQRRTFDALQYERGSMLRDAFNLSPLTSEYMPSYKFVIVDASGIPMPFTFRTKREAEEWLSQHHR